ncbi:hypothetical protein RND61_12395 [Streptomyces sp. TRM76323]|uniref:NlpC/P60 domain-containing protein n=1 Tax=Streptomyces tamarix TaxID=3078565 RepID=A0ABU3QJB0_9ACTN|nr:hypothetical protein [Streptomyces tamarix]MDT9682865.1 hypothetical protein [Streptomyces tamarix]
MEHDWQTCVENAVAWARGHLGETSYASRCLAFVEDAYERSNHLEVFGGDFARESAELYAAQDNTGTPPIGAFVFYDTSGELFGQRRNWGHVGLSLGDGRVIHAWDRVRIDHYLDVQDLGVPPGWDAPRWIGWTPVQRVFQGCRPRDWSAVGDAAAAARRMQAARFGPGTATA